MNAIGSGVRGGLNIIDALTPGNLSGFADQAGNFFATGTPHSSSGGASRELISLSGGSVIDLDKSSEYKTLDELGLDIHNMDASLVGPGSMPVTGLTDPAAAAAAKAGGVNTGGALSTDTPGRVNLHPAAAAPKAPSAPEDLSTLSGIKESAKSIPDPVKRADFINAASLGLKLPEGTEASAATTARSEVAILIGQSKAAEKAGDPTLSAAYANAAVQRIDSIFEPDPKVAASLRRETALDLQYVNDLKSMDALPQIKKMENPDDALIVEEHKALAQDSYNKYLNAADPEDRRMYLTESLRQIRDAKTEHRRLLNAEVRDNMRIYDGAGNYKGLDWASIASMFAIISPVALAYIQIDAKEESDKRQMKWTEQQNREQREFEEEQAALNRASAAEIAGINAAGKTSPTSVGRAASVSLGGATQSA